MAPLALGLVDSRVAITGPGRSQDDHQRTELWREDLHGGLRGQQHADV
jgi:hypothetical protein